MALNAYIPSDGGSGSGGVEPPEPPLNGRALLGAAACGAGAGPGAGEDASGAGEDDPPPPLTAEVDAAALLVAGDELAASGVSDNAVRIAI